MKFHPEYLENLYLIKPLCVQADISNAAISQALRQLDFNLELEYKLYLTRAYLSILPAIVNGILNITVDLIEEDQNADFWYIVCKTTKTIVYSPGV